ncbi:MAG TPA: AAA family ATPase, partial [Streptosporangiaceae bacterium]|nr:AAA family ATPase [Streptosporangiaceae bacterium]
MNNDTPQVSGEDTHGYPHPADSDDGEDFPAFRGWGDRVEPVAPDDYPQPSFSSYEPRAGCEPEAGYEPGYAGRPGPGQPGYPAGPGYAPESGYERGLAYAPGMSYDEPGVSYALAYGYPRELGFAEDPGYGEGSASGAEAVPVPPMEQLPDSGEFFGIAIPVAGDLEFRSDARPEPDLVPEAGGAAEPAAARGLAAPPIRMIPAPVAALPPEATQSWDVAQSWERAEAPDEGPSRDEGPAWHEAGAWHESGAWQEGGAWQESGAWHEGGAWHEAGDWLEPGAPEAGDWQEPGAAAAEPPPAPATGYPERDYPELAAAPETEYTRETSASLTSESLLHGKRAAPGSGWRRGVYRATGGLLRFGESAAEMRRRDLINRVRTSVAGGHHRVAVLSLKGGVGKTTTAVGLGATLATLRGDRVIAVDANPDRGTLSDKVRLETSATIRDLLNERGQVGRYADVRAFTSQAPSRLEVLASDRDPAVSVAFGAEDYSDVARVLEHFYSICITDCGTGLLHSAMSGVLSLADQIILVSSPSVDGARSASATLDWLEAHNCGDLVRNGVVVLSAIRPKSKSTVDIDRLEHHFAARCRAVARIPYDPHLEEGAEIEL